MPNPAELLAAYDGRLRTNVPEHLPNGARAEWDGPLLRLMGLGNRGWVLYRDLSGLDGADLDDLIARQVRVFAERGERFEWKWHAHDRPPDLPQRLRAAGFVPEDEETVVIASVDQIAGPVRLPAGVSLREVTDRSDFDRIAVVQPEIWQEGDVPTWLGESLEAEMRADPDALTVLVVEADGAVVCAAWVRFESGTDFATFWGGGTVPPWRRHGVYRATVAYRANLARDRGFRFIEVDASDDSRPILERLGFVAVTTTTPYVWSPPNVEADSPRTPRVESGRERPAFILANVDRLLGRPERRAIPAGILGAGCARTWPLRTLGVRLRQGPAGTVPR